MNTATLTWDGILLRLKDYGVKYVYCYYSGGGDSGCIDEFAFYGADADIEFNFEDNGFTIKNESNKMKLQEESSLWNMVVGELDGKLMQVEDWYNNDGGYGEMLVEVDTGRYLIDNNCYITQEENFKHCGKFESNV